MAPGLAMHASSSSHTAHTALADGFGRAFLGLGLGFTPCTLDALPGSAAAPSLSGAAAASQVAFEATDGADTGLAGFELR